MEGGCAFCGKRWSLLHALGQGIVTVPVNDTGSGMFVLCEPCWVSATVEDRVAAHLWLTRSEGWRCHGDAELARMRTHVESAVRADDIEIVTTHGGRHVVTRQRSTERKTDHDHS